jgi:hypothetical protein
VYYIEEVFIGLSKLLPLQVSLIIIAFLILYIGPVLIKNRYLRRNNLTRDDAIDDRNLWILYPKQYSLLEKIMMVLIYLVPFILLIVAVNAKS